MEERGEGRAQPLAGWPRVRSEPAAPTLLPSLAGALGWCSHMKLASGPGQDRERMGPAPPTPAVSLMIMHYLCSVPSLLIVRLCRWGN